MTVAQADAFRGAASVGRRNFLDTGTGNATIEVYEGARPAPGDESGSDPLVVVVLAKPCGVIAAGSLVLTANDSSGELIARSGIAAWARFTNGDGQWAFDCDVSLSGGTGEVQFPNLQLYAGGRAPLAPSTVG